MAEYIEREAAKRAIMSQYLNRANKTKYADVIDAVPAADVVPVVHGAWVDEGRMRHCLVCGRRKYFKENYCPNCGALMDKDGDGE